MVLTSLERQILINELRFFKTYILIWKLLFFSLFWDALDEGWMYSLPRQELGDCPVTGSLLSWFVICFVRKQTVSFLNKIVIVVALYNRLWVLILSLLKAVKLPIITYVHLIWTLVDNCFIHNPTTIPYLYSFKLTAISELLYLVFISLY